jgi:hypothetical protein
VSYAIVEDVAASWEGYAPYAAALAGPAPEGLILHAAGRTDEGFRIIGIWESEEAWLRFAKRLGADAGAPAPHQVFRALRPEHVVYGGREK